MKLCFYGKKMVRLEMTEKQLATLFAALDSASYIAEEQFSMCGSEAYADVAPLERYLKLLYWRADKARNEILS